MPARNTSASVQPTFMASNPSNGAVTFIRLPVSASAMRSSSHAMKTPARIHALRVSCARATGPEMRNGRHLGTTAASSSTSTNAATTGVRPTENGVVSRSPYTSYGVLAANTSHTTNGAPSVMATRPAGGVSRGSVLLRLGIAMRRAYPARTLLSCPACNFVIAWRG